MPVGNLIDVHLVWSLGEILLRDNIAGYGHEIG